MITYTMPDTNLIAIPMVEYERLKASRESLKKKLLSDEMVEMVAQEIGSAAPTACHWTHYRESAKATLQAVMGEL